MREEKGADDWLQQQIQRGIIGPKFKDLLTGGWMSSFDIDNFGSLLNLRNNNPYSSGGGDKHVLPLRETLMLSLGRSLNCKDFIMENIISKNNTQTLVVSSSFLTKMCGAGVRSSDPNDKSTPFTPVQLEKANVNLCIFTATSQVKHVRNVDVFFFPVNKNNQHWTLYVLDARSKTIVHHDSLGNTEGDDDTFYSMLYWYLSVLQLLDIPYDVSEWTKGVREVPQQNNCNDCGVFTCYLMDVLSQGLSPFFIEEYQPAVDHQQDTPFSITVYRKYIAYSLLDEKCN